MICGPAARLADPPALPQRRAVHDRQPPQGRRQPSGGAARGGMPSSAAGIAREHLEAFLAAVSDRVSPATVATLPLAATAVPLASAPAGCGRSTSLAHHQLSQIGYA